MADKSIRISKEVDALRTVTPDKAFSFYTEIGQSLGATAKSLGEFAAIVKGIDPFSTGSTLNVETLKVGSGCWGTSHWRVRSPDYEERTFLPDELRGR
jgi:hypothetical protein